MKYTKEIFDILSRGGFICSNSVRRQTKTIYDAIEDNYEEYREYYSGIGFNLESGNGYYYFTRQESRVELDAKLDRFVRWIDRLDFLKTFNNEKAMHLYAEKLKLDEVVDKLVDELEKIGFVEKENELDGTWKVTSAFHYIEELVDCLTVSEEVRNEVLE